MDAISPNSRADATRRYAIASAAFSMLALPLSVFCGLGLPAALTALALAWWYQRQPTATRSFRHLLLAMAVFSVGWSALFLWAWVAGSRHRLEAQAAFVEQLPRWRGVRAPAAGFRLLDSQRLELGGLRGRPVLLTFWRTDVPPCLEMATNLIRLRHEVAPADLGIVAVSIERPDPLQRFVEKLGVNYDVCWLGRMDAPAPPFDDIKAVPTTFFIGRDGVIREVLCGATNYAALKELALAPDWSGPTNAPPPFTPR